MIKKFLIFIFLFLVVIPFIVNAQSASLFFLPSSGSYSPGQTFTVYVKVNSGGSPGINAADGVIKFDPSKISVIGLSNQSSIFNLWTTQPTFSNSKGQITFSGGTPQAYSGNSGTIFSITFKALNSGTAKIYFESGSVLAADGKGTNVLLTKGTANFSIKASSYTPSIPKPTPYYHKPSPTPASPIVSGLLPPLPQIKSSTHPDPNKWYQSHNPKMSWNLPSDITSVALLIGKKRYANPTVIYTPPISTKQLKDLEDGIWYFHVRFKNGYGWGKVATRKIKIDSTPPEKFSLEIKQTSPSDALPILVFKTDDKLSGVDYYDILIDNVSSTRIAASKVSEQGYKLESPLSAGEHIITVEAVDIAGNKTKASAKVDVQALKPPTITSIPSEIKASQTLIIKGTSYYPNASINIYFEKGGKKIEQETKTDKNGNWVFIYPQKLEKGSYSVWAKVVTKEGESLPTKKYLLKVSSFNISFNLWLVLAVIFMLISAGLAFYLWYLKTIFVAKQKNIKENINDLRETIKKVFMALREELEEDIVLADRKKGLSKSEAEVRDKLREAIDVSEELIKKDFKTLEKELKE